MANSVTLINKKRTTPRKVLHNGDIIVIRDKQYLVTSLICPKGVSVKAAEKASLCSIISIRSGNPLFSNGIERNVSMQDMADRINTLLGVIRDGSPAHRDRHDLQDITDKAIRVIPRKEYDLVIEKL